ncbi:MAG: hypothetical protein HN855_12640 [Anaerolineae bacterium]|jgi:hypothetical protein|nr:hypothetical protein [Anaerolineae bacterium]MBT7069283.1 hypothetical protein [Anaerolineae bacterium]MBT7326001.1 hypothetical protein [Anaerolineae bacterium]
MKKLLVLISLVLLISACGPSPEEQATMTAASWTATSTSTLTPTSTATFTLTPSLTPTLTYTPTMTFTPSLTPTPTFAFPTVEVSAAQAHCRYGPNIAYLHAADLYAGDTGTVRSRWYLSKWLYVKFDKLDYFCWVAPSVVTVTGDIETVIRLSVLDLTRIGTNQYGAPKNVVATRNGSQVIITWAQMKMTKDKDRGYFLDLFICQDDVYLWWPISFPDQYTTSYTIKDEAGCPYPSSGMIYTVEKHGYSQPKTIAWPAP